MSYLTYNYNFDFNHPRIQDICNELDPNHTLDKKEFAIKSYYFVRDNWPYYPYKFSLKQEDWQASNICTFTKGHCLDKAIIYITLLRKKGIPARLGLAKVKNHIAVEDIVKKFGNDVLVPHGYVELLLDDNWIKATPAFNQELCQKLGVCALDFNGENDSLFQEYNKDDSEKFMEYLEDYGTFEEVPLEFKYKIMWEHYPDFQKNNVKLGQVLDLSSL